MHEQSNPLDGKVRLGETHCDQCGEWRVLSDEGICVFCDRHTANGALQAAEAALEGVAAVVRSALEGGRAHVDDIREVVEKAIDETRPFGCGATVDELWDQLISLNAAGVR